MEPEKLSGSDQVALTIGPSERVLTGPLVHNPPVDLGRSTEWGKPFNSIRNVPESISLTSFFDRFLPGLASNI